MFRKAPQYVPNQYVAPPPRQQGNGTTLNSSIHNAEVRNGSLESRIQQLERQIIGYKQEMKRSRPGTASHNGAKRRALQAMRQKKSLESRIEASSSAAFNLEQIRDAQSVQQENIAMVQGLKVASKDLRVAQNAVDLDEVEDLRDDMQEALEEVNEVSESLGRSYDVENVDQSELEAELAEFEQDALDLANTDSHKVDAPSYLQPSYLDSMPPASAHQHQQPSQQYQQQQPMPVARQHAQQQPTYENPQMGGRY